MFTGLEETAIYIKEKFALGTKLYPESEKIYSVRTTCRADIARIGHYMYDNATIYMNRKYDLFQRAYSIIESET